MDKTVFGLLLLSGLSVMSSSPRRQFIYVGLSMSWMEAQSYCRDQYVDLVTLNDMGDVELLKVYTKSTSDAWIGLKRAPQLSWGWSAGENTLLDYSAWDEGEPGNSSLPNRLCGAMYFGSWSSLNCSTPLNFVCYSGPQNVFYLVNLSKSWPDAQVFCRNSYTDLATIGSPLEQTQVSSLLTTADTVWVGLFADSWVWSDEGSSSFRYWKTDNMQSLSDTSDCAVMDLSLFGTWTNLSCVTQLPFFCYKYLPTAVSHRKRQIVKVKVSSNGEESLNDPLVKANLLQQIEETLKAQGMVGSTSLGWSKSGGIVFHQMPEVNEERYKCDGLEQ